MNGRKAREQRQTERARLEGMLADSLKVTPMYRRTLDVGSEVWTRGTVMFVIPVLRDDYPEGVKAAVDRRRRASLTGVCDCGATWVLNRRGRLEMAHEDDCPASDDNLDAIAATHDMTFRRLAT